MRNSFQKTSVFAVKIRQIYMELQSYKANQNPMQ